MLSKTGPHRRRLLHPLIAVIGVLVAVSCSFSPQSSDGRQQSAEGVAGAGQGGDGDDAEGSGDGAGAGGATSGPPPPPPRQRAIHDIPPTEPGKRPPQFVLVSFDGTGGKNPFDYWLEIGERSGAHLTFFLSGVYLLDQDTKNEYDPPRHKKGASDIGFIPVTDGSDSKTELNHLLANLDRAWWAGHEIGTHFNGHFCGPSGVELWTQAEWTTEINEFDDFLTRYAEIHGLGPDHVKLPFGPDEILGGRTPCLEGKTAALYPAEKEAGFRYDTSKTMRQFEWPKKMDNGMWDMSVASVPVAGTKKSTLLMDYNFYFFQSNGKDGAAASRPQWRTQARDTLQAALDDAYVGNRAPVVVGNHFNDWNGNIYTEALAAFLLDNCRRPEVMCVTHEEVVNWLDKLAPGALQTFQDGAFPKTDITGTELPPPPPPATAAPGTTAKPATTTTAKATPTTKKP